MLLRCTADKSVSLKIYLKHRRYESPTVETTYWGSLFHLLPTRRAYEMSTVSDMLLFVVKAYCTVIDSTSELFAQIGQSVENLAC